MKQFILSLVAMTIVGAGTMTAQRNNRQYNNDDMYSGSRTEMRRDNGNYNGNVNGNYNSNYNRNYNYNGNENYRGSRDMNGHGNYDRRDGYRGGCAGNYRGGYRDGYRAGHRDMVVREVYTPVHRVPAPRPVYVERYHHGPSVGAVVTGAVVGAVLTSLFF